MQRTLNGMKFCKLIGFLMMIFLCYGCGANSVNNELASESNSENNTELSSIMNEEDNLITQSEGSVAMGFQPAESYEYTFDGNEMEVPLYVGTSDNSEDVEVAALLFLNGEVQPYAYELNGNKSEEKLVHYFTLGTDETVNFTAYVTPISGNKGDVVGMQFATIFKSDYLPDIDGNTSFGNCGKINSTICIPVTMEADGVNETKSSDVEVVATDIPDEIMATIEGIFADGTDNPLDYMSELSIKTEDNTNLLYSENGKLHLTLQMYGGKEVRKKIAFFINNEPVNVLDSDYVEVTTTTDKMTVFEVDIDVSDYDEICSFYAVAATTGEDYIIQDDTLQSERCLLINK